MTNITMDENNFAIYDKKDNLLISVNSESITTGAKGSNVGAFTLPWSNISAIHLLPDFGHIIHLKNDTDFLNNASEKVKKKFIKNPTNGILLFDVYSNKRKY